MGSVAVQFSADTVGRFYFQYRNVVSKCYFNCQHFPALPSRRG